jgi:hypothetical protein
MNGYKFQVRQMRQDGFFSVLYQNQNVCICIDDPFHFVSLMQPWTPGWARGNSVQEVRKRLLCNHNR